MFYLKRTNRKWRWQLGSVLASLKHTTAEKKDISCHDLQDKHERKRQRGKVQRNLTVICVFASSRVMFTGSIEQVMTIPLRKRDATAAHCRQTIHTVFFEAEIQIWRNHMPSLLHQRDTEDDKVTSVRAENPIFTASFTTLITTGMEIVRSSLARAGILSKIVTVKCTSCPISWLLFPLPTNYNVMGLEQTKHYGSVKAFLSSPAVCCRLSRGTHTTSANT